ncbi:hypothetical protein EYF80_000170 [Liparis tanakae]|uniref:Uncharacterized protein n=1 Tax=Liparis tanakae TaxID=230148 RepID=A0A4Z2JHX5_9TELE|nr:hypothetical protein EYF80_000170 [Liparis tanakae]
MSKTFKRELKKVCAEFHGERPGVTALRGSALTVMHCGLPQGHWGLVATAERQGRPYIRAERARQRADGAPAAAPPQIGLIRRGGEQRSDEDEDK